MMDKLPNKHVRHENAEDKHAASTSKDAIMMECRACLTGVQENECFDVFCAWNPPWPGMGLSMAEDLAKLAGIQISVSDPHSKIICKTCCIMLQNAISFMLSVQNSDISLKKRLNHSVLEASSWPKPIQIDKNMSNNALQDMEIDNIKEEVVSEDEFDNNDTYNDARERSETLDIKIEPEEMTQQHITIEINNSVVQSQEENQTSMVNGDAETQAESEEVQDVKEEPLSDDESVAAPDIKKDCMLCMKTFLTVRGLKAHVIAVHSYDTVKMPPKPPIDRTNECPICNRCFETRTDLFVHETCHSNFTCYVCDKKFDSFHQLSRHRTKYCKKRTHLPRLKTLDDVRRIAGHGGTKTLQIFDMQIPISQIKELQIDEIDCDIKQGKRHIKKKVKGKDENDILGNILNKNVMSVIVNVRLPCDNVVQPKKEQNDDNSTKDEQMDLEMLIPRIEISEKPELEIKTIVPGSKQNTDPLREIPIADTQVKSSSKLPEEAIEHKAPKVENALELKCLKKLKKKSDPQNLSETLDESITTKEILKQPDDVKEILNLEDQEKIIQMKNNGIDWTVKDGRVVAKKKVDPLHPCRKQCSLKIPEEFRQRFFDYFWCLYDKQQKRFAASLIKCKILDKIRSIGQRDRKCTFTYRLKLFGECYDICKGCLLQTIGVQSTNYFISICNKAFKKKMKVITARKRNTKRLKLLESSKIPPLMAASIGN